MTTNARVRRWIYLLATALAGALGGAVSAGGAELPPPRPRPAVVAPAPRAVLPAKAWVHDGLGPMLNQGPLGSCGPNAIASLLQGLGYPTPSRLFIYWEARVRMDRVNKDSGVSVPALTRAVVEAGWPDEVDWPYTIELFRFRPSGWAYLQASDRVGEVEFTDVADLKASIAAGVPVMIGFRTYPSFDTAVDGDIPAPKEGEEWDGGHLVVLVGYDDATQRWTFKNSYGRGWGRNGFGTLPYTYPIDPPRVTASRSAR